MSIIKLFCLAHAGGSATMYYRWNKGNIDAEIMPLELPGRGTRWSQTRCQSIEEATEKLYQQVVTQLKHDEPYMLFGHSMGSLLAYELAHQLIRNGYKEPAHLFVSGGRAPHIIANVSYVYESEEAFKNRILEYDPASRTIFDEPELYDLFVPILKADLGMLSVYQYREQEHMLDCPITALAATDDPSVPLPEAAAWNGHTKNVFNLETFEGGHFFIHQQTEEILGLIQQSILLSSYYHRKK